MFFDYDPTTSECRKCHTDISTPNDLRFEENGAAGRELYEISFNKDLESDANGWLLAENKICSCSGYRVCPTRFMEITGKPAC